MEGGRRRSAAVGAEKRTGQAVPLEVEIELPRLSPQ